ncbi:MAG: peptidylprolyl isomerase [Brevinema sp.]
MLKKIILGIVALFSVSCGQNKELVSYTIDGKTKKVMTKEALEDMRSLYEYVNPQDLNAILSVPKFFKSVVQNRLFEADLLTVEAKKISNYQDDLSYKQNREDQKQAVAYNIAYQKSLDSISNAISKQNVEVAVVSRIMFTNQGLPQSILDELLASENPVTDFALAAEKYSQEILGAQNGGYLGHVKKGQFTVLDDIVFEQKYEGIYPEILQDQYGSYLIFVHTPARRIKVIDIEKEGIMIDLNSIQMDYIVENTDYKFTVLDLPMIILNGVEKNINDLSNNDVLLELWKKKYTVKEIQDILRLLLGRNMELSQMELITLLAPSAMRPISPAVYQLALMVKEYNKNIMNSKQYKEQLAENQQSSELEIVYGIVSQELYRDVSTNVSAEELMTFYNNTNNRIVTAYSDDGQAVYANFRDSQEELTQKILAQRVEGIQEQFLEFLAEEYNIVWNEENVEELRATVQEDFDEYILGLSEGFEF